MPQVGFEHTTAVFERAKRVYALDRAATVIDFFEIITDQSGDCEEICLLGYNAV
jgi:hypothetical protein